MALFFVIVFSPCKAFADESESKKDDWVIAVSQFSTEGVGESYQNYKTIIPEMFLIYLDSGAKRLVPFEEKKLRAAAFASNKRITLIKERAKLITERDNLFLSIDDVKTKTKKKKKLDEDIAKKEKEIFYSAADINIEENRFFQKEQAKNIALWEHGEQLYKLPENGLSAENLKKENISAVISGTIKDVSGYMLIKVKVDTGIIGMPVYEFSDAGNYDDAEQIVQILVRQIYTVIQNTKEIKVFFDVMPKDAKLYIDNKKINDFSTPIVLTEGSYIITASAENYADAVKEVNLKNESSYLLKINLKKNEMERIGFSLAEKTPHVFFRTRYSATVPGIITIPNVKAILEFDNKGVHTFGLFNPEKNKIPDTGSKLSPDYIKNMIINLNKKNVKDSVELHRKILYWSLAAFYVSLPVTMILQARLNDEIRSLKDGKFPPTQENTNKVNKLGYIQQGFQWVSIALGVNYFIQLVIYLVKADRSLPRQIKPDYDNPKYKVKPENKVVQENEINKQSGEEQ